MKKLFIIIPFLLLACDTDETPEPIDPFIGSWTYTNISLQLAVSFDVDKAQGEYVFNNIAVEYPEIQGTFIYEIDVFDKFLDNDGFGQIKIRGGNDVSWIFITLTYNTIYRNSMDVHDLKIEMINREPIEIKDQRFTKIE
jgi:hypothetical protein